MHSTATRKPAHAQRAAAFVLAFAMQIVSAVAPAQAAEDCAPEPQGSGRISMVIDARTLRLEDGREIRLAGIETPALGPDALAALVAGRDVTLYGDSDTPDRYGRQSLWVFVGTSDTSLQAALVAQGAALTTSGKMDSACRSELLAAEAEARRARRGVWAAGVIKNAESPDEVSAELGRFTVVEGWARSVRQAGGITYINFGRSWTRGFAVTIPKRALALFEAAGMLPKALENRRLRIRGFIGGRRGPRIEALHSGQIEVLDANVSGAGESAAPHQRSRRNERDGVDPTAH